MSHKTAPKSKKLGSRVRMPLEQVRINSPISKRAKKQTTGKASPLIKQRPSLMGIPSHFHTNAGKQLNKENVIDLVEEELNHQPITPVNSPERGKKEEWHCFNTEEAPWEIEGQYYDSYRTLVDRIVPKMDTKIQIPQHISTSTLFPVVAERVLSKLQGTTAQQSGHQADKKQEESEEENANELEVDLEEESESERSVINHSTQYEIAVVIPEDIEEFHSDKGSTEGRFVRSPKVLANKLEKKKEEDVEKEETVERKRKENTEGRFVRSSPVQQVKRKPKFPSESSVNNLGSPPTRDDLLLLPEILLNEKAVKFKDKFPDFEAIKHSKRDVSKAEMNLVCLKTIFKELKNFISEKKDLMLVYTRLYSAFKVVKKKTGEIETRKTVLNNLNYKIKSLYQIYPHLAFYGPVQLFTFRTVVQVPEILVTIESEDLRKKFQKAQDNWIPFNKNTPKTI